MLFLLFLHQHHLSILFHCIHLLCLSFLSFLPSLCVQWCHESLATLIIGLIVGAISIPVCFYYITIVSTPFHFFFFCVCVYSSLNLKVFWKCLLQTGSARFSMKSFSRLWFSTLVSLWNSVTSWRISAVSQRMPSLAQSCLALCSAWLFGALTRLLILLISISLSASCLELCSLPRMLCLQSLCFLFVSFFFFLFFFLYG